MEATRLIKQRFKQLQALPVVRRGFPKELPLEGLNEFAILHHGWKSS